MGADGAEGAIVSTGDDITASILTTLMLKDLGVADIYVKVVSHDHARVVEHMGVTETIFPERESALNLDSKYEPARFNLRQSVQPHGQRNFMLGELKRSAAGSLPDNEKLE